MLEFAESKRERAVKLFVNHIPITIHLIFCLAFSYMLYGSSVSSPLVKIVQSRTLEKEKTEKEKETKIKKKLKITTHKTKNFFTRRFPLLRLMNDAHGIFMILSGILRPFSSPNFFLFYV